METRTRRRSQGKRRAIVSFDALEHEERPFAFLHRNERDPKPRSKGLTEIRGPYYSTMGRRYLDDLLETVGMFVDSLKFAGGAFSLFPRRVLREFIQLAHQYNVEVSTGGFIEFVLTQGVRAVADYIRECSDLGFDIIEISSGFISIPEEDVIRLIKEVQAAGLQAKPEIGIQFGAGGATAPEILAQQGTVPAELVIERAKRYLDAGVPLLMLESEGITENVSSWRTEIPARFASALGMQHVMFEAADPAVFSWYIKTFGPEVNLFVDHSQIVQLECLRQGIWGTADSWGRIVSYKSRSSV